MLPIGKYRKIIIFESLLLLAGIVGGDEYAKDPCFCRDVETLWDSRVNPTGVDNLTVVANGNATFNENFDISNDIDGQSLDSASLTFNASSTLHLASLTDPEVGNDTEINTPAETDEFVQQDKIMDYRLPTSLLPMHYDLELRPNLDPATSDFDGTVTVWFTCVMPVRNVTLHAYNITVQNAGLVGAWLAGQPYPAPSVTAVAVDSKRDFLTLEFDQDLVEGAHYGLMLNYTGQHTDGRKRFRGLARTFYTTESGETRWLMASHFEPTSARKAFPCFDEPMFKATFNISIVRWPNMTAITNMHRIASVEREDGLVTDYFAISVKMSTYTVAFTVSDLTYVEEMAGNTLIRIWARPEVINETAYALHLAPRFLNFMEKYINISYPLQKLDIMGIPNIYFGAMENWGLIIFAEENLLYNEGSSNIEIKRTIRRYLAHEIAHQWFGNLVTMKWWNDIWLNEGLTSYMERVMCESLEPESTVAIQNSILSSFERAMIFDQFNTAQALSFGELAMDEIHSVFTFITYEKGALISRMAETILGEHVFRKSLQKYVENWQYQNVELDDLLYQLEETTQEEGLEDVDIKSVLGSWARLAGYPIITVTRDYTNGTAYVRQSPFSLMKSDGDKKQEWEIPITFTSASQRNFDSNGRPQFWHHSADEVLVMSEEDGIPGSNEWMIFNIQRNGYYRVNYDNHNWKLLIKQLLKDHTKIPFLHRVQILDDMLHLTKAGYVSYSLALSVTEYLVHEKELHPWDTGLQIIDFLNIFQDTPEARVFRIYKKHLLNTLWNHTGVEWTLSDGSLERAIKRKLVMAGCRIGLRICTNLALEAFNYWKDHLDDDTKILEKRFPIPIEVFICIAIRERGEDEWNFVWGLHRHIITTNVTTQILVQLRQGLSCTYDPWLISRYLEAVLNPTTMNIQLNDGIDMLYALSKSSYINRQLSFNFLKENWSTLLERYAGIESYRLVQAVAAPMKTRRELNELLQFISCLPDKDIVNFERIYYLVAEGVKTKVTLTEMVKHRALPWLTFLKSMLEE